MPKHGALPAHASFGNNRIGCVVIIEALNPLPFRECKVSAGPRLAERRRRPGVLGGGGAGASPWRRESPVQGRDAAFPAKHEPTPCTLLLHSCLGCVWGCLVARSAQTAGRVQCSGRVARLQRAAAVGWGASRGHIGAKLEHIFVFHVYSAFISISRAKQETIFGHPALLRHGDLNQPHRINDSTHLLKRRQDVGPAARALPTSGPRQEAPHCFPVGSGTSPIASQWLRLASAACGASGTVGGLAKGLRPGRRL